MAYLPTQKENPAGLHQRYHIEKIVLRTEEEMNDEADKRLKHVKPQHVGEGVEVATYKYVATDPESEYFVLRLDTGGSDINHVKACRIGIHAYADAIEATIPELAKDLRERYPLL
jgi:hypothetical protein